MNIEFLHHSDSEKIFAAKAAVMFETLVVLSTVSRYINYISGNPDAANPLSGVWLPSLLFLLIIGAVPVVVAFVWKDNDTSVKLIKITLASTAAVLGALLAFRAPMIMNSIGFILLLTYLLNIIAIVKT
jgi:hypothetical protein